MATIQKRSDGYKISVSVDTTFMGKTDTMYDDMDAGAQNDGATD